MVINTAMTRKSPKSNQKLGHEKVLQCLDRLQTFRGWIVQSKAQSKIQ